MRRRSKGGGRRWARAVALGASVLAIAALIAPGFAGSGRAEAAPPEWLAAVEDVPPFLFREGAERPRRARVSGQELYFRVERTEARPPEVIAFYRQRYRGSEAWLARLGAGGDRAAVDAALAQVRAFERESVFADDRRGVLAMLEPVAPEASRAETLERVHTLTRTGSVSALWTVRLVLAYGDEHGTSIVSLWTGEAFNLHRLGRPAAGSELPSDVPAPQRAEALLSAAFPDEMRPAELAVFAVESAPELAWSNYVADLARGAWVPEGSPGVVVADGRRAGTFRRGARELQVTCTTRDDGRTVVSLFHSRG